MKYEIPIQTSYQPTIDISPELKSKDGAYYQYLIGILIWMVELGRIDVYPEFYMISIHLSLTRLGNLEQLYHMFAYLKTYHNSEIVLNTSD